MCHPGWGRARIEAQRLDDLPRPVRADDRAGREADREIDRGISRGISWGIDRGISWGIDREDARPPLLLDRLPLDRFALEEA
ncbi:hypothetical protein ACH4SP_09450 [Streptomyces sp. NPDC021093]|uniref:hypothetical protein n=1 Tax=Streptomyces sp. NPDC021093 TaxID=3365112 RepID=UPI0037B69916